MLCTRFAGILEVELLETKEAAHDDAKRLEQALNSLDAGDFARAFRLLTALSDQLHPCAMAELGRLYFCGMGVTANRVTGTLLLYDARMLGSRAADTILWQIGDDELLRVAVKADLDNETDIAIYILAPLAHKGNREAQFQLATIYDRLASPEHIRFCVQLYSGAVKSGFSDAWNNLDLLQRANLVTWDEILEAME